MPSLSISDIQNDTVRKHMENCEISLSKDDFNEAVRSCADAYIYILNEFPAVRDALQAILDNEIVKEGLSTGSIRNAPLMWPRYGAKIDLDSDKTEVTFDRRHMSFVEAINYQEFTLALIFDVQNNDFEVDPSKIRSGI